VRWGIPERSLPPTSPSHRSAMGPLPLPLKGGEGSAQLRRGSSCAKQLCNPARRQKPAICHRLRSAELAPATDNRANHIRDFRNNRNEYSRRYSTNHPPAGAVDHDAATPCRGAGPTVPAHRDCSVSTGAASQTAICRRNAPNQPGCRVTSPRLLIPLARNRAGCRLGCGPPRVARVSAGPFRADGRD
jgi:hypothetical protein